MSINKEINNYTESQNKGNVKNKEINEIDTDINIITDLIKKIILKHKPKKKYKRK